MKKIHFLLFLFAFSVQAQQGGMWLPNLLEGMNETEMKNLGMKMSAEDIYNTNASSLKDAIVHFDGGCTAEIISNEGLMLTNHHCGYDAIQTHSSLENDYLQDGFWAANKKAELANPSMTATLIVSIKDVTEAVLKGTENLTSEADKQKQIEQNINTVQKSYKNESWQENKIKSFFEGNQYILFVTETFKDVRLVGAPPSSIGKFGSDTDNWVWPRHTGDFSLFRIYAGKDNKPAPYSLDNVPYTPKHFLPISLDGISEDDFTLVFGFPGRTQEYLPAVAIDQIVKELNPAKIEIREQALAVQDAFMRKDNAIKIQYASKFARIANYWKKWIGENKGLIKSNAVELRKEHEQRFLNNAKAAGKSNEYKALLDGFEKNYAAIAPYSLARDYFIETAYRNTELLNLGFQLYNLERTYEVRGEQSFLDRKTNLLKGMPDFYKNYNNNVDKGVFDKLMQLYIDKSPLLNAEIKAIDVNNATEELYTKSALTNLNALEKLLNGDDAKKIIKALNNDPAFSLAKKLIVNYFENIAPQYEAINLEIEALQRNYMKAQIELFPNERIFPDANSTLRVTYGKVAGYSPSDAVYYKPVTHLEGIIEKFIPGDYEFDVPKKLLALYESKDYGNYADENGKIPVCFIGTNHTTGGNSGSPAIDAEGNLIGLNFDRVWEGTMSDINYSPEICRNIMVDVRYILFIIDKYANASHLIDEMKLVHPKK